MGFFDSKKSPAVNGSDIRGTSRGGPTTPREESKSTSRADPKIYLPVQTDSKGLGSPRNEGRAVSPRNGPPKGPSTPSTPVPSRLPDSSQNNHQSQSSRARNSKVNGTPEPGKCLSSPRRSSSPSALLNVEVQREVRTSKEHKKGASDGGRIKKGREGEALRRKGNGTKRKKSEKEQKRKKKRKKIHRKNSDNPDQQQKRKKQSTTTKVPSTERLESHTTLSLPKQTSSGTIQKRKATNPSRKHASDSQIKKQTGERMKKQISSETPIRHTSEDIREALHNGRKTTPNSERSSGVTQKVGKRRRAPSKKRVASTPTVESESAVILNILPSEVQDFSKEGLEEVPEDLFTNGQVVNMMIELNLQQNKLTMFPEDISLCSKLIILDISYNNIPALPGAIGALHALEKLSLSGNPNMKLPVEIARLTKLRTIRLAQNRYVSIPEEVFLLSSLKKLNLSRNNIVKVSPKISAIPGLKVLNLAFNKISELPQSIGSCSTLEQLDLRENCLKVLPDQICNLSKLETAIFLNNKLTELPQNFKLVHFPELALLDVQYNEIEELSYDFFEGSSKLYEFYSGHNRLSSLPVSIAQCTSLVILDFKKNFIEKIPNLSQLQKLSHLNLGSNQLEIFPPGLGACTMLRTLNLFGNRIEDLPEEFANLVHLKHIYLGYNNLKEFRYLDVVNKYMTLKELVLSGNPITNISEKIFSCAWRLTCLFLNNMNLSTVPKEIGYLEHLEQLDLSHNKLSSVPVKLGRLKTIYSLDLSHNELKNSGGDQWEEQGNPKHWDQVDWWCRLESIGIVDLSHNLLVSVPLGLVELMETGAAEVRLDHNPLIEKKFMSPLKMLSPAEVSFVRPTGHFQVGWSEMVGQRPTQEDCFCIAGPIGDPDLGMTLFGLFDGHASRSAAQFAAINFTGHLLKHVPFENLDSAPLKALRSTYYTINEAWREVLTSPDSIHLDQTDRFCGTTGVVVLIIGNRLYAANVGDSRAVLYKGGAAAGEDVVPYVQRLTHDHKPEHVEEEQRVRDAGGYVVENRLAGVLGVSRGLGDFFLWPLVSSKAFLCSVDLPMHPDAFLLLCCDGVWDELTDEDAVALINDSRGDPNLHRICTKLRDYAFLLGSDDNISTIIIKWN